MNVPHLLDFLEASLSGKALDKARRNQGRTDWTGVQTQYSEKWSLFWSVAALKTVVYPFHFISFLTHQSTLIMIDRLLELYMVRISPGCAPPALTPSCIGRKRVHLFS